MIEYLVIVLSFLTGFLVVTTINLAIGDLFQQDQGWMKERLREQEMDQQRERARGTPLSGSKDLQRMADEAAAETAVERPSLRERFQQLSQQSGLRWPVSRFVLLTCVSAVVAGLLAWLASRFILAGLGAGVVAGLWPLGYMLLKRSQRLAKLQGQLPDCFDLMARVIQSGQTIAQAFKSVADEFEAPAGAEFGYCYEQQNLGLSPDLAYRGLAQRTGVLELKILVLALLVHRQTGGNLAALLGNLSSLVRERATMRGKIQGLTAEGRLQGAILLGLPPLVFVALLFMNYDYAIKLFDHPSLIIVSLTGMVLGAAWIRRIINFDF